MRVLFGMILGVGLVIGLAFFHDNNAPTADKKIVNWDVLGAVAREQTAAVRSLWNDAIVFQNGSGA